MLLVVVQLPVAGLYSSAVAVNVTLILPPDGLILTIPPATKTWPFGSSVAVWDSRGVVMLPVTLHLPETGSYSSALVSLFADVPSPPPATSTRPLGSNVAVWPVRTVFRLPVVVQKPEAAAMAGTAVLANNPMVNSPITNERIGRKPSAFARIIGTSSATVRMK